MTVMGEAGQKDTVAKQCNFWEKAQVFIQMSNYILKFEGFRKLTGLTEKEIEK